MGNKKGFTLVELLAVIVILAVIILIAVNAVLPQMNRARKNSFADEAMNYLKAAETKYVEGALDTTSDGSTVVIKVNGDLNQKYVSKTGYYGMVVLTVAQSGDNAGNVTAKKIWLTDCKKYMITGQPTSGNEIKGTNVDAYSKTSWEALVEDAEVNLPATEVCPTN